MNFYFAAPVWSEKNDAPNVSKLARAGSLVAVKNVNVIVVKQASYRGAQLSGTFVLGEQNRLPLSDKGWHTVEVYCRWFGLRLKTRGLHLKVNMSTAKVERVASASVVTNISL